MISREKFLSLYKKYLEGLCTPEEIDLLDQYQDEIELTNKGWEDKSKNKQEVNARIWERLGECRELVVLTKIYKKRRFIVLKIAAVLLLALSAGLFAIYHGRVHNSLGLTTKNTHILPESTKAILTLADGSKIILTDAKNGKLAARNGIQISKTKDGTLVYHFGDSKSANKTNPEEINTITTSKGGQYQLILSDGTKVWLNAMSSLSFPVAFTGITRDVKLTGEAYFEVVKNKDQPFIVKANGTNIQVLGTHFNVSAYQDDPSVTTTLLEGSVRLVKESSVAMLTPGQQGTSLNSQTTISVKTVDVDKVMAWKDGYILFDNTDIHTIMKQAARWYDVDVVYQRQLDEKTYGGKISRYKDITDLLKNLELTGTIHFKVEGRRVTVMQ